MTSRRRSDFVQGQAAKSAVAFVQLWACDLGGRLRGVTVTASQLEQVFDDGVTLDVTALGAPGTPGAHPLVLVPDPSTWAVLPAAAALPGAPVVARMFCDVLEPDGAPSVWDSRGVLKRALGRAVARGYTFYAGATVQHYLLAPSTAAPAPFAAGPSHGFGPSADGAALQHATVHALEQLGVVTGPLLQGPGPGQQTLDFAWTDALTLADTIVTHRRVTRDLAHARGLAATFMPFPFADAPGNALGLHLSLHDGDTPLFWDPSDVGARSSSADAFAAGLEAAGAALSLLARPTVNSYTRAVAAPPYVAPARARGRGEEDAQLAVRGADPSANPHLLLAALLDAGLSGLEAAPTSGADPAPVTLVQAADLAARSPLLRRVLGAELLEALVAAARAEGAAYRQQVTPWELTRYLDLA